MVETMKVETGKIEARRPRDRYTAVAIALHWLIAALILTNIWFGWQMDDLRGMAKFNLIQLHKSVGITILVLTLARIAWRLTNPPPPYDPPLIGWEHRLSSLVHIGFYVIMLGLPLTGWALVSLSPTNLPTLLFKTIPWPHIGFLHDLPIGQRRGLAETASESHHLLVKVTYLLLTLHVAGALKHTFISRDSVAYRMIPLPFLRGKAR
jgi:cytochrome b561